MGSSHLTGAVFCHVLIVAALFYFTSTTLASPLTTSQQVQAKQAQPIEAQPQQLVHPPAIASAAPQRAHGSPLQAKSAPPVPQLAPASAQASAKPKEAEAAPAVPVAAPSAPLESVHTQVAPSAKLESPVSAERKMEMVQREVKPELTPKSKPVAKPETVEPQAKSAAPTVVAVPAVPAAPVVPVAAESAQPQAAALVAHEEQPIKIVEIQPVQQRQASAASLVVREEPARAAASSPIVSAAQVEEKKFSAPTKKIEEIAVPVPVQPQQAPPVPFGMVGSPQATAETKPVTGAPVVMGGLGPLHLLATTLCSYQPDKPVADEHLNQLYARRASVRKSLFEFMSLKFTNLEKLSSRLGYGLQVVPVKSQLDNKSPGVAPSHGWPVVGKCTAYDLRLMGEAAWCECHEGDQGCPSKGAGESKPAGAAVVPVPAPAAVADEQPARITSNQHAVAKTARSISSVNSFLPSPEESSVISKLLHVSDIKDAPSVESTIYNLNLTQHQLATLEAHATSTLECRRNALRYTKALLNHLAEDQRELSESWPRLYALVSSDDCARKRIIDIFNALSGFRTDTTSIRRDNLEFAFAMDDLRAKVLENEVNVPLTFDRHFIEVEQFLQQSVRLMLANIQPKRAKLTSMRYRSLMYGASQQEADDQCIDLHQRLLARNYPNDCNPTQFGQLPDSLRMTASSLELWSIEKELSLHMAKETDYPNSNALGQQKVKENVNECIANLVSS